MPKNTRINQVYLLIISQKQVRPLFQNIVLRGSFDSFCSFVRDRSTIFNLIMHRALEFFPSHRIPWPAYWYRRKSVSWACMLNFKTDSRTHCFNCLAANDYHLGLCRDSISSAGGHLNFLYVNTTARTLWRREFAFFLHFFGFFGNNGRMQSQTLSYKVSFHWLYYTCKTRFHWLTESLFTNAMLF